MDTTILQKRIDEYNTETNEILKRLVSLLDNIQLRLNVDEDDWSEEDFEFLEETLSILSEHHYNISAFVDGCMIANGNLKFDFKPILQQVLPILPLKWAKYLLYTYKLNYDNIITSFVSFYE